MCVLLLFEIGMFLDCARTRVYSQHGIFQSVELYAVSKLTCAPRLRKRNEHGNDSLFRTAVEIDALIAILWHIFCFSDLSFISLII